MFISKIGLYQMLTFKLWNFAVTTSFFWAAMKNYTLVALMEPLIQVSIVLTAVIRDGQGMR
jgi:hypothetical protein